MTTKSAADDGDLFALASRQHWLAAYWQLEPLGFTRAAVFHRMRKGRLFPVHAGVYALGHPGMTPERRDMAAVLACGPGALLSHWSAAARWRLLRGPMGLVHVTVFTHRRHQDGIRVHRSKPFHKHDRTRRDGIPITSIPRTLLDLAPLVPENVLTRAANEAYRQGRLNRNSVEQLLARNPGRSGTPQLRSLIAAVSPQTRRTRSDLEALFLTTCTTHGVPIPVMNRKLHGYTVDAHW